MTPAEWQALALSAQVALAATALCVPPGILAGWVLARYQFPGKLALEIALQLPMVLPPVVPGVLLLWLFGTQGPIGAWLYDAFGLVLAFDWKGAVVASAVMAFPLLVQPIRIAFQLQDPRLLQAAATLGARPGDAFFTIALPLALPGLLGGTVLCFSRSLGEFGATMAFVGNIPGATQTLPLAIYSAMNVPGDSAVVVRLVALSIGIAVLALAGSHWLTRHMERRLGFADPEPRA